MNRWMEKIKAFNDDWKDLPRKLLVIVLLLGCLFLLSAVLPYVFPFAIGAVFAWMINPAVTAIARPFARKKLARGISSLVLILLVAGVIIMLLTILAGRIFEEAKALTTVLPGFINTSTAEIIRWFEGLNLQWEGLDDLLQRSLGDLSSTLTSVGSWLATTVARGAWQAVGALPRGILFLVLSLVGAFYASTDKDRIFAFLRGLLPERYARRTSVFRANVLRAILTQMRAAFIMIVVNFTTLTFCFLVMRIDYAILLALVISVLDALPVLGAGLFLLPMCAFGIASGNATLAIGGALSYLAIIVMRQLLEPRIIGKQLGLYPLATMMAMYAGLRIMGFVGMLLGPLTLLLCKVAISVDQEKPGALPIQAPKPPKARIHKEKR